MTYKIIRMYQQDCDEETIKTGLTLEEAREHCKSKETSSSTACTPEAIENTLSKGPWFDGYEREH